MSNQDKFGKNKKFVVINDNNIFYGNVNNSYKKVFTFHHEKLGHLISEISGYYKIENRIFRTSTTERKKHKFLTIIYYKPN